MNNRNLNSIAVEEIWKENTDGYLPVLLEIFNPDIKWNDNSNEQENMYLRVINDTNPVVYKGKKYIPCSFNFALSDEDGKKINSATITLSTLDSRIVQMLRSIDVQCEVTIMAMFAKKTVVTQSGTQRKVMKFFPLEHYKGKLPTATYDNTKASLTISYKDVLSLNVPRTIMTKNLLPSVLEE